MQYILIIFGLILIYLSTKNNSTNVNDNNDNKFSNVLEVEIINTEITMLKNQYIEILNRIEEIESSLILLKDQIERKNNNCLDNKSNCDENNVNITSEIYDNCIEEDINSKIFQLSDEGKDLDEICSSLKLGKGEVLLRLGLRK